MNEQQRTRFFSERFGEQGSQFAARLESGDLDKTMADMDSAQGLEQRIDALGGTLNARTDALMGTLETTAATLFTPALKPLSDLAEITGNLANSFNELLESSPGLSSAATRMAGTAVVGLGLFGASRMANGGSSMFTGLKQILGGKGGTIAGLAAGKLAEAAGAQSVFVTNWPDELAKLSGVSKNPITDAANAVTGGGAAALAGGKPDGRIGRAARGLAVVGGVIEFGAALGDVGKDVLNARGVKGDGSATWLQQILAKKALAEDTVGDAIMGRKDEYVTINGQRKLRSEVEQFAATGQLPGVPTKPQKLDITVHDERLSIKEGDLTREASRG